MLLVALVICPSAGSVTANGLYGLVEKGPIRPVCPVGKPCDAPAQVTLLFSRMMTTAPREYATRSQADGTYRIALPPGYYTVTTKEKIGITRNIHPHYVHARRGSWDRINFSIDTGIR
jgi:hypothetical protein